MATVSNKHANAQRVFYPSFNGGLNLSVPGETLAKNELREAINVEFSPITGSMRVRGGLVWSGQFNSEIDFVVPVIGKRGFLARVKGTKKLYYFRWNNIWGVSGELSGDGDLSIVPWGDDFVIASGGKLQKFTDFSDNVLPTIETIENSPDDCRFVFVRNGRVGVVSGDDTISFSYVGDCELWDNDPDDESTGQFVEIGYKDGMNINAIMPLSRDLIIFKAPNNEPDKGIIWRLTGDFPDWNVLEVAHNIGTFNQQSVQAVGNDIFFITVAGIASLSSVTEYGEIKTSWIDRKVSNTLTPMIDSSVRLWNITVKQQLWVMPSEETEYIWVFDYAHGIWTKFLFPAKLIHAAGVDDRLYVFIGRDLYEVNDWYSQDELKEKIMIEAKMKLGTIINGQQTLIKGVYASFDIQPQCSAELSLKNFKMPFRFGGVPNYVYDPPNNTRYISEDNTPLFPDSGVLTARRKCIVRDWAVIPEIRIYGGGCAVSTLGLEMAEV